MATSKNKQDGTSKVSSSLPKALIDEWDFDRNSTLFDISPSEIAPKSNKSVWWRCEKGHSWKASVSNRVSGHGCPYCSNRLVLEGYNDLVTTNPDLIEQWDYFQNNKNGLFPNKVTRGSNKRAYWICTLGHSWVTTIKDRAAENNRIRTDCPFCTNRKVLKGFNDFESQYPDLMETWNYNKNTDINPCEIIAKSNRKVWWLGKCGHEWSATISSRVYGSGCPICSHALIVPGINDFKTLHPGICSEWHQTKNADIDPSRLSSHSKMKVWWLCPKGHEFCSAIADRVDKKGGCPICSNQQVLVGYNDLATTHPELAQEWDRDKNEKKTPEQYVAGSTQKVWWICKTCGNSWRTSIVYRKNGTGCPRCSKRMKTSFPEQAVYFYVKKQFPDAVNGYSGIQPGTTMELDIYIPQLSIGIEYDGEAWHSSEHNVKNDIKKFKLCQKRSITLIRIKEKQSQTDSKTADKIIYRETDLTSTIQKLRQYISLPIDIDVNRDEREIKENYYLGLKANSLSVLYPLVAKQWHPTKNVGLRPDMFFPFSPDRVWWLCEKGHEYKARIRDRTAKNSSCPYCSGNSVLMGYNDLTTSNPKIAAEWNFTKNGKLSPNMVPKASSRIVWWTCPNGHEYKARISDRTAKGSGCPFCSGSKAIKGDNDLATIDPKLAAEWHPTKNRITPDMVLKFSTLQVWWIGKCGHEWKARVLDRSNGYNCPYCAGKRILLGYNDFYSHNPEIASEWDYDKNAPYTPQTVTSKSKKKVWWICPQGHSYNATIQHRSNGSGCPFCENKKLLTGYNDLATTNPALAREWNNTKNQGIKPTDVLAGSNKKVWWKCPKCEHEWEARVYSRSQGHGCPLCAQRRK